MNENWKKQIAAYAILYLKNRITLNQKLISMGRKQIQFEKYVTKYERYMKLLDYYDEQNGNNNIIDGEKLVEKKDEFVRFNSDFVVLTEKEIDELLEFVKISIENYGLNRSNNYYNETFFIKEILMQLITKSQEENKKIVEEKLRRLKRFLSYLNSDINIGFCQNINGHISFFDNCFQILNHDLMRICIINNKGQNELDYNALETEDILLIDNIYVGNLTTDEQHTYVFLEKVVNGQRKMKAISHDGELYDIVDSTHPLEKVVSFSKAIIYGSFKEFLEGAGCEFLISNIYQNIRLMMP